jgi:hypothetical protein
MKYEILKVANGFVVKKPFDACRGSEPNLDEVYVFNSWVAASTWLDHQFDKKTSEAEK